MESVKWTDKIKKCSCARKNGRRKNNAELIRKRKRNWLDHWLRRNCLLKVALEEWVNWRKVSGRIRYQMIDNIMINELMKTRKGMLRKE